MYLWCVRYVSCTICIPLGSFHWHTINVLVQSDCTVNMVYRNYFSENGRPAKWLISFAGVSSIHYTVFWWHVRGISGCLDFASDQTSFLMHKMNFYVSMYRPTTWKWMLFWCQQKSVDNGGISLNIIYFISTHNVVESSCVIQMKQAYVFSCCSIASNC